jgi:hypothetical protein
VADKKNAQKVASQAKKGRGNKKSLESDVFMTFNDPVVNVEDYLDNVDLDLGCNVLIPNEKRKDGSLDFNLKKTSAN